MFGPDGPSLLELVKQGLSSTRHGYDLLAPRFDATPFRTPTPVLDAVDAALPLEVRARSLDLCCGTGAAFPLLARRTRDAVVGIDLSAGMLREARRAHPALHAVQGDLRRLPFTGTFGWVTCFGALGHVLPGEEAAFARAIHDVLEPGGAFAFVTAEAPKASELGWWFAQGFGLAMELRNAVVKPPFHMDYRVFWRADAERALRGAGLSVAWTEGFAPAPFGRLLLGVATREPATR